MKKHGLFQIICLIICATLSLAYNDDPPNGRTGAPFNGSCADCHNNNNPGGFNGIAQIQGLPDTILPNTPYSLRLKVMATAGNPVRAGFQLVVVDQNNQNSGDLSAVNSETDTELLDGREYLDHRSGKYFGGMPVFWDFHWTSPSSSDCNTIKFYYIVNFCNGGGDFGDYSIPFADSVYFSGGIDTLSPILICPPSKAVCKTDTVRYVQPIVSDNCGTQDLTAFLLSGLSSDTIFPIGITTQVFQATDFYGNNATCSFSIEVYPPIEIVLDSLNADVGNAGIGRIEVSITGGSGAPYFLTWRKDGVIFTTNLEDLEHLFSGNYSLEVLDSLGCSATLSGLILENTTRTQTPIDDLWQPKLYPQPTIQDWFFIGGLWEAPAFATLYQSSGQVVKSISISNWPGPFQIPEIPRGVYVLRIQMKEGQVFALRLVK